VTTLQQKPTGTPAPRPARTAAPGALRPHVISAIFRRDFLGYFSGLAGYVFIALFVLVCSVMEFCLPAFFANNLANLAPLNEWMPYLLLFFIPAITMGIWADERRQGTDELLLTLPARDVEVVLGKYLAALGIYTVALLFLLPHALALLTLGAPDLGVLAATYFGYWLMGAMLIAIGMVASLLSSNATVAFILGGVFAAIPIFLGLAGSLLGALVARLPGLATGDTAAIIRQRFEEQSVPGRFHDFGVGVLTLSGVIYFLSWAAGMLYLNMVMLSRRHWAGGQASSRRWTHAAVRVAAVALGLVALNRLVGLASARWDFTTTVLLLIGVGLGVALFVVRRTVLAPPDHGRDASPVPALLRDLGLGAGVGLLACFLAGKGDLRADASQERLSSLSRESIDLINQIPADRPVFIQAYLSPQVPREYVETKADLVNLLKEFAARGGGDRIRLNLIDTERYSPAAREAEKRFGITSRRVPTTDEGRMSSAEIFLGVAFTSGPEEVVVPFFDLGLPVEYELTRSVRVVSRAKRKKVGILGTDAKLLGGFDMRSMGQNQEWSIVTELKKQYEVSSVSADSDLPADLDALLVAQPSSLPQKQVDRLTAYVRRGGPALLLLDPLPMVDPSIAPEEPRAAPGGMFGGGPQPEPKGDLRPLLELINLDWPTDRIVWNPDNPTKIADLPPEILFVRRNAGAQDAFNPKEAASSGLQEVVLMFAGELRERGGRSPRFTPLLETNDIGGTIPFAEVVQRSFMGVGGLNNRRAHLPSGKSYVVAARIEGPFAGGDAGAEAKANEKEKKARPAEAKVIAIADLDLISEQFFALRRQRAEGLDFDNVTFVLNSIDVLTGDDAFLGLRKKRPRHRTLTAFEEQNKTFEATRQKKEKAAEDAAREELEKAQKDLDARVKVVQDRKDLDERTKEIMMGNLQDVENRRLNNVIKVDVEDRKRREIQDAEAEAVSKRRSLQAGTQFGVLTFPPLLPLILGAVVVSLRTRRENRGTSPNRLAKPAGSRSEV